MDNHTIFTWDGQRYSLNLSENDQEYQVAITENSNRILNVGVRKDLDIHIDPIAIVKSNIENGWLKHRLQFAVIDDPSSGMRMLRVFDICNVACTTAHIVPLTPDDYSVMCSEGTTISAFRDRIGPYLPIAIVQALTNAKQWYRFRAFMRGSANESVE